jgi:hypothetical protein
VIFFALSSALIVLPCISRYQQTHITIIFSINPCNILLQSDHSMNDMACNPQIKFEYSHNMN